MEMEARGGHRALSDGLDFVKPILEELIVLLDHLEFGLFLLPFSKAILPSSTVSTRA
jgi:hypothetical protein